MHKSNFTFIKYLYMTRTSIVTVREVRGRTGRRSTTRCTGRTRKAWTKDVTDVLCVELQGKDQSCPFAYLSTTP